MPGITLDSVQEQLNQLTVLIRKLVDGSLQISPKQIAMPGGLSDLGIDTPQYYPLSTPLTAVSWTGTTFSTTAKTLIGLVTVFGVPANTKSVDVKVQISDTGSARTDCHLILGPTSVTGVGKVIDAPSVNGRSGRGSVVVPCDEHGDIYYQVVASGAGSMTITLQVWGYWT